VSDNQKTPANAPVRVKVYGLVALTRRTYLLCQTFGLALGLFLMAIGLKAPREGFADFFVAFLNILPAVSLVILTAGALETLVVMGQFRKKEAERKAGESINSPAAVERKQG
jgi:hypothetical protein